VLSIQLSYLFLCIHRFPLYIRDAAKTTGAKNAHPIFATIFPPFLCLAPTPLSPESTSPTGRYLCIAFWYPTTQALPTLIAVFSAAARESDRLCSVVLSDTDAGLSAKLKPYLSSASATLAEDKY
jgi:hypothetical protein